MITLTDVYAHDGLVPGPTARLLYNLMRERNPEINISHKKLPTYAEHVAYCNKHPYRYWYLIERLLPGGRGENETVGTISATHSNEIGIVLFQRARHLGIGSLAINRFMATHHPVEGVPGLVNGEWLANIAPTNTHSQHVFGKLGFRKIQETYARPHPTEETRHHDET